MQIIIGLAHYPQTNVLFKADEVGNMVVDMKADKVDMMFWFWPKLWSRVPVKELGVRWVRTTESELVS